MGECGLQVLDGCERRPATVAIFLIDNDGREAVKWAQTDLNQAEGIVFCGPYDPRKRRQTMPFKIKDPGLRVVGNDYS